MPRPRRSCAAGEVYHLINRGNKKARIFIEAADYQKKSRDGRSLLSGWPVPRPADWLDRVNRQQSEATLKEIRKAIARGRPGASTEFLQL